MRCLGELHGTSKGRQELLSVLRGREPAADGFISAGMNLFSISFKPSEPVSLITDLSHTVCVKKPWVTSIANCSPRFSEVSQGPRRPSSRRRPLVPRTSSLRCHAKLPAFRQFTGVRTLPSFAILEQEAVAREMVERGSGLHDSCSALLRGTFARRGAKRFWFRRIL